MNNKFRNLYRIPSARATWHSYNSGSYFITICTKNNQYYFGEVINGIMHLSPIGEYLFEVLKNVKLHFSYADIIIFAIMPNHIHSIIYIYNSSLNCSKENNLPDKSIGNEKSIISPKKGFLSVIVRSIKSAVTKFANENKIPFAWQSRFYDHIIRNDYDFNLIADYIENNAAQWEADCFYGHKHREA